MAGSTAGAYERESTLRNQANKKSPRVARAEEGVAAHTLAPHSITLSSWAGGDRWPFAPSHQNESRPNSHKAAEEVVPLEEREEALMPAKAEPGR